MRRMGGGDDAHFRQIERAQHFLREAQMTVMNGIESAAKDTDHTKCARSALRLRVKEVARKRARLAPFSPWEKGWG